VARWVLMAFWSLVTTLSPLQTDRRSETPWGDQR
jgi:hypothetical protein